MAKCPYCDYETPDSDPSEAAWREVAHMQDVHPEIVRERLIRAGIEHSILLNEDLTTPLTKENTMDQLGNNAFMLIEDKIHSACDGDMLGGIFTGFIVLREDYWEKTYIVAWVNEREAGTHQANVNSKGECSLFFGHYGLTDVDAKNDMAERANLSVGRI